MKPRCDIEYQKLVWRCNCTTYLVIKISYTINWASIYLKQRYNLWLNTYLLPKVLHRLCDDRTLIIDHSSKRWLVELVNEHTNLKIEKLITVLRFIEMMIGETIYAIVCIKAPLIKVNWHSYTGVLEYNLR